MQVKNDLFYSDEITLNWKDIWLLIIGKTIRCSPLGVNISMQERKIGQTTSKKP